MVYIHHNDVDLRIKYFIDYSILSHAEFYKVEVTSKARKYLEKIDPIFAKKIRDKLRSLEDNPIPLDCLKLEGFVSEMLVPH